MGGGAFGSTIEHPTNPVMAMRTVKWSIRDGRDGTSGKHYHGKYVVFCTDMDGDGTEWSVWLREEAERKLPDDEKWKDLRIAHGFVSTSTADDFAIAQAISIEALDAIIRDREEAEKHDAAIRDIHAKSGLSRRW